MVRYFERNKKIEENKDHFEIKFELKGELCTAILVLTLRIIESLYGSLNYWDWLYGRIECFELTGTANYQCFELTGFFSYALIVSLNFRHWNACGNTRRHKLVN